MAKKKNKEANRFVDLTTAAENLETDLSTLSRKVKTNAIPTHEMQIYINAGTDSQPEFHPVKGRTIRVIDMNEIETKQVVKFRRK